MARKKKFLSRLLLAVSGIAALVLLWQGWGWWQAARYNQALVRQDFARAADYPGWRGQFAKAFAAQQRDEFRTAVEGYAALQDLPAEAAVQRDYNLGTLYLQQGLLQLQQDQPDVAWPLLELAKSTLRAVLRQDSKHWPAKFNLEQALSALPDPLDEPPPPRIQPKLSRRSLVKTPGQRELP